MRGVARRVRRVDEEEPLHAPLAFHGTNEKVALFVLGVWVYCSLGGRLLARLQQGRMKTAASLFCMIVSGPLGRRLRGLSLTAGSIR